MSGFWTTSDGDDALETGTEYDAGGKLPPIPEGTSVLAVVESAGWKAAFQSTEEFVNIQWRVQKPAAYANRVIFQKLWVEDFDPSTKATEKKSKEEKQQEKKDKALRMLAAIDANAGGKLARKGRRPGDDDLAIALQDKAMVLKLGEWAMGGNEGNWVMAVAPKTAEISDGTEDAPARKPKSKPPVDDIDDDDVPF